MIEERGKSFTKFIDFLHTELSIYTELRLMVYLGLLIYPGHGSVMMIKHFLLHINFLRDTIKTVIGLHVLNVDYQFSKWRGH